MKEEFVKRLENYLSSECEDYAMVYKWEWNEDTEICQVEVKRDDHTQNIKYLNFRYNELEDDLTIELCEDSFYITREFDHTVKYFWMLTAPALFPNN